MGKTAAAALQESYRTYAGLLALVGHAVDREALIEHLTRDQQERGEIGHLVEGGSAAESGPDRQVRQKTAERMGSLARSLCDQLIKLSNASQGADGDSAPRNLQDLTAALQGGAEVRRDALAADVLLDGHRPFIRPREMSGAEWRQLVAECQARGQFILSKVVPHVRAELVRRGCHLSDSQVGALFKSTHEDAPVPYCLKGILRGLGQDFCGDLIPMESLVGDQRADQWLNATREKLSFRSHSAMHKAIAKVTGLKYDCVHKSLSGRKKARRIQSQIKACLDGWLRDAAEGRPIQVGEDFRGVPLEEFQALLPELEKRFPTKDVIYQVVAGKAGVLPQSVRRYFQGKAQSHCAPLDVYTCARELAEGPLSDETSRLSYLEDAQTREAASDLARRANCALLTWRRTGQRSPTLENTYRQLRRALIATIKEGRSYDAITA